jgi:hypothetical protein
MALSNAERCRRYRRKRHDVVTARDTQTQLLQTLIEEVSTLCVAVVSIASTSPLHPPYLNPLDIESHKKGSPPPSRSSSAPPQGGEPARLARLDAWMPNDQHKKVAFNKGHDPGWLDDQATLYRNHQANAKAKHKDFDKGFMNWILRSPLFEGKTNEAKLSPVDKLYLGASRAAKAWAERERARLEADEPLLDC